LGFNCCYNQNAKVEKVDDIGNWAKENGEWCGIGYTRCSFEVLGYHCCSSVNPKVVKEDSYGKWGEEDGELCGI
ncbi:Non-catalytic module family DOC2, partial [Piromyces sp. E2]